MGYLLVWLAATLWASLGPFYKLLLGLGVSPLAVVTFRTWLAALLLGGWMIIRKRSLAWLSLARRDRLLILAYGLIGIAFFYAAYVYAVQTTGVAIAVVLMYTAPAWVTLIAWWRLGEHVNRTQVMALALAFLGCALVAQIYDPAALHFNALGILYGLSAGLGYGLYSVFNKLALRRYPPTTVQFYGFAVGTIALALTQRPAELFAPMRSPLLLGLLTVMAVGPTLGGGLAYAAGVQRLPVNVASLLATLEPALAVLFGYWLFGEVLEWGQWLGAGLILLTAILLRPRGEEAKA